MIRSPAFLHIGDRAARVGLNPKTIRYYESLGLLPPPQRSAAGYRLYQEQAIQRLTFIRQARTLGLRLRDIRDLLTLHDAGRSPCAAVLTLLEAQIARIDEQIRALTAVRQDLVQLHDGARQGTIAAGQICGIIEHAAPGEAGAPV